MSAGRPVREDLVASAERLRQVVALIGSRKEAADVGGVTVQQIWRYLSARSAPSADVVAKLALKAGCSLEWVMTGVGDRDGRRLAVVGGGDVADAIARSPAALAAMRKENPEWDRRIAEAEPRLLSRIERYRVGVELLGASGATPAIRKLRAFTSERHEDHVVGLLCDLVTEGPREVWPERARLTAEVVRLIASHLAWGPHSEVEP